MNTTTTTMVWVVRDQQGNQVGKPCETFTKANRRIERDAMKYGANRLRTRLEDVNSPAVRS